MIEGLVPQSEPTPRPSHGGVVARIRSWTDGLRGWWVRAEHRRLRWILVSGLLIRLVLAPLTSWAVDTPGFVLSAVGLLYSGNPYSSTTWFNPPLAPFLAEPFIVVPVLFQGPQGLLVTVSSIAPMTMATGVDGSVFPTPGALLAWKLPLILADSAVCLLLHRFGRSVRLPMSADALAVAWFLNPLVIWASSVHGEVDALAAMLVLAAFLAFSSGRWLFSGLALGLAIFAKGYPLVLLPVFGAALLASWAHDKTVIRERTRPLLRWLAGLGISAVPFLYLISPMETLLLQRAANPTFGGISVLGIFNAASPKAGGWYASFASNPLSAVAAMNVLRGVGRIGICLAVVAVYVAYRRSPTGRLGRLEILGLAIFTATAALVLSYSAPQPENLVGVLVALLIALPGLTRAKALTAYVVLSAAGLAMYWSFLTPAGMFYPLANLLGPWAIRSVNGSAISFVGFSGLRGSLWLVEGLVGGGMLLAMELYAWRRFLGPAPLARLRRVWRKDVSPAP